MLKCDDRLFDLRDICVFLYIRLLNVETHNTYIGRVCGCHNLISICAISFGLNSNIILHWNRARIHTNQTLTNISVIYGNLSILLILHVNKSFFTYVQRFIILKIERKKIIIKLGSTWPMTDSCYFNFTEKNSIPFHFVHWIGASAEPVDHMFFDIALISFEFESFSYSPDIVSTSCVQCTVYIFIRLLTLAFVVFGFVGPALCLKSRSVNEFICRKCSNFKSVRNAFQTGHIKMWVSIFPDCAV